MPDFAKLMHKRINTRDVMVFCEEHQVSYDRLRCGDLGGLRRMTREHQDQAGQPDDKWVNFLRVAIETIPPHQRRAAIDGVWKIAKQS
jgi:hypothetical protein